MIFVNLTYFVVKSLQVGYALTIPTSLSLSENNSTTAVYSCFGSWENIIKSLINKSLNAETHNFVNVFSDFWPRKTSKKICFHSFILNNADFHNDKERRVYWSASQIGTHNVFPPLCPLLHKGSIPKKIQYKKVNRRFTLQNPPPSSESEPLEKNSRQKKVFAYFLSLIFVYKFDKWLVLTIKVTTIMRYL